MGDLNGAGRPVIVIYSNCQGVDLTRLMRSAPSLAAQFEVRLLQFHLLDQGYDIFSPELFEGADFVWEQLGTDYPHHRERMHSVRPPGARTVTFPSLNMLSLWPFTGSDPRIQKEPMFPGGRFPWPDVVGAEIGADPQVRALSDGELLARYAKRSGELMPDLDRRLAIDVMRWRERDATSDVKVADFLLEHFRTRQLFYSYARPSPTCSGVILKQLLAATSSDEARLGTWRAELEGLLRAYVGYDTEASPVNPAVARHFDLTWYSPDNRQRHHGQSLTFDEYIVRYIRYDPYVH